MRNIALIGVMGCGKTEASLLLAYKLKRDVIEIDMNIERHMGMKIKEIFAQYGEKKFRELERDEIRRASRHENVIISTGGGAVLNDEAMTELKKTSTVVFIERDLDEIIRTVDTTTRPLLKDGAQALYDIYAKREVLYRKYADKTIFNEGTLDELVDNIISACKKEEYA